MKIRATCPATMKKTRAPLLVKRKLLLYGDGKRSDLIQQLLPPARQWPDQDWRPPGRQAPFPGAWTAWGVAAWPGPWPASPAGPPPVVCGHRPPAADAAGCGAALRRPGLRPPPRQPHPPPCHPLPDARSSPSRFCKNCFTSHGENPSPPFASGGGSPVLSVRVARYWQDNTQNAGTNF
jgi:hypothetical protein